MIKHKINRGFTLLELMIVVVMVAILAAVTVPKLVQVSNRNKLGEATNLFQQTMAEARALAMKNRRAVVVELRSNQLWVNLLDGADCNAPIRGDGTANSKRCFRLIDTQGSDTIDFDTQEFTSAGVAMCDIRVATISSGSCVIQNDTALLTDGVGLCYNGTGQLWVRVDEDTNTGCTAPSAPSDSVEWQKACVPWVGNQAAISSTRSNWFSGADVRFNRFTSGSGACPVGPITPSGAEDITRRIIVPAGGHPFVKLAVTDE